MYTRLTVALALPWLALAGTVAPAAEGPATAKRPVYLEVRLPADARLQLDDYVTQSTGPVRRFESPEVPTGKVYYYKVSATWQGKAAARQVDVQPGQVSTVEFRPEDFAAGRPVVKPSPPAAG